MPRAESIYTEKDNTLSKPLRIHGTIKPLVPSYKEDNKCCKGSFFRHLFCLCGICE